jgi:hypothetical protein
MVGFGKTMSVLMLVISVIAVIVGVRNLSEYVLSSMIGLGCIVSAVSLAGWASVVWNIAAMRQDTPRLEMKSDPNQNL